MKKLIPFFHLCYHIVTFLTAKNKVRFVQFWLCHLVNSDKDNKKYGVFWRFGGKMIAFLKMGPGVSLPVCRGIYTGCYKNYDPI